MQSTQGKHQFEHQFKQDLRCGIQYTLIFGVICLMGWLVSMGHG